MNATTGPTYKKRTMWRGDTFDFDLDPIVDAKSGVPVNLTGTRLQLTVKNNYVDPDTQAVVLVTSDAPNGNALITVVDAARGLASITINPIATRAFPDGPMRLVYDVQLKDVTGKIRTIESGLIYVYPDVGRSII